jgi:hypothetical protein
LIRAAGAVLLDVHADKNLERVIRDRLETRAIASPTCICGRSAPAIAPP